MSMSSKEGPDSPAFAFRAGRRRAVSLSPAALVKTGHVAEGVSLPLVFEPAVEHLDAAAWAAKNRALVESELLKHGALLFRNFDLDTEARFEAFARAVTPDLLDYRERSSPRTEVSQGIYTSTDHPPDEAIRFHNEQSYTRRWPMKLWFYCAQPAAHLGGTPLADGRTVLRLIGPEIAERFRRKRVMYVRNYSEGLGLTWQTAFQTESRAAVEDYCRRAGIKFEWRGVQQLRTRQVFDTVVAHPVTGDEVWFEHAAFFHVTSLQPAVRNSLLALFKEEDLPFNTYYGDGSPLEVSALAAIESAYRQAATTFAWRRKDLLLIDNMLTSHAREPYTGPRKILVAMADLYGPPVG